MQSIVLWPNVDAGSDGISKGIRVFRENHPEIMNIQYIKNICVEDYARLIKNCAVLIGNSSSGLREGAYLGVPVVNIGLRQQFRERGMNVVDAGYDRNDIAAKAKMQIEHGSYRGEKIFGNGDAGKKMAEILASLDAVNLQKSITY